MKRKLVRFIALFMSSMLFVGGLTGCQRGPIATSGDKTLPYVESETTEEEVVEEPEESVAANTITLLDLKKKYGVANETQIKPFYNVDQQTEFVFHFKNKEIEPCYAVTVHTDPKCELNSTVYQLNDGYITDNGLDVVVKPGLPVLNETTKWDNYNWGNAPIYYLAIRYDMESTEIKPLDEPIIVPFTIYSKVSTPNAEANINSDGSFELTWKPVDGAEKYNIYEAIKVKSTGADQYTRAECGYVGDHLSLLTTVDSNTTSFTDFKLDGSDNTLIYDNYVIEQNFYGLGTYYIAAVDKDGNESQLSMAICGWKYENQLPHNFDKYNGFNKLGTSGNPLTEFPDTVEVEMADKTVTKFPVNFKKLSEPKDEFDEAVYEYSIVGTKLTGTVRYLSEDNNYPDNVESTIAIKEDIYKITNDINIVPENTLGTIPNSTKNIDLSKKAVYPEEQKLPMNNDTRLKRADIEGARIIADGIYVKDTPYTIGSYLENGTAQDYTIPEHVEKEPEGLPTQSTPTTSETTEEPKSEETTEQTTENVEQPSEETTEQTTENTEQTTEESKPETSEEKSEEVSEETTETKPEKTEETTSEEKTSEETTSEEKPSETTSEETTETQSEETSEETTEEQPTENPDEITSKELVDEQIEVTKEEVEEANKTTIELSSYPVFADSAEEEYLATCMINADTEIDISAFPSLANREYLQDVLIKVVRQNPYILSASNFGFSGNTIKVVYELSTDDIKAKQEAAYNECKNIVSSVITSGMSDEEKILAIWKYLEDNTSYDHEACDAAMASNFTSVTGHEDAFNIYGIMCKKVGVCQSYSYVYKALLSEAGVPCISLVGCCQKTMPHAWNAVKLNGTWYWIDATNNSNTTGIPYFLYQSSSTFAENNDYVLDDEFDLNTNLSYVKSSDDSKDFYVSHDLVANSNTELPDKMANAYKLGASNYNGGKVVAVRYNGATVTQDDLYAIVSALQAAGMSENEIMSARLGQASQYVILMY